MIRAPRSRTDSNDSRSAVVQKLNQTYKILNQASLLTLTISSVYGHRGINTAGSSQCNSLSWSSSKSAHHIPAQHNINFQMGHKRFDLTQTGLGSLPAKPNQRNKTLHLQLNVYLYHKCNAFLKYS